MRIADRNGFEPDEEHGPCPTDPLGTFLHGPLTMPDLCAAGGFRVTDNATAAVSVEPGRTGDRTRWCGRWRNCITRGSCPWPPAKRPLS